MTIRISRTWNDHWLRRMCEIYHTICWRWRICTRNVCRTLIIIRSVLLGCESKTDFSHYEHSESKKGALPLSLTRLAHPCLRSFYLFLFFFSSLQICSGCSKFYWFSRYVVAFGSRQCVSCSCVTGWWRAWQLPSDIIHWHTAAGSLRLFNVCIECCWLWSNAVPRDGLLCYVTWKYISYSILFFLFARSSLLLSLPIFLSSSFVA